MAREDSVPYGRERLGQDFPWPDVAELAHSLVTEGLLEENNGTLALTAAGEARAAVLLRCHRLAERLLSDVLEVAESQFEANACVMEHVLSAEVADSICTLLGHPSTCPHGRPIPRGACCKQARRELQAVVAPLSELPVGASARIAYIATRRHERLDRLAALGVLPGTVVHVHQRRPALVVQLGETQLALDDEVAEDIFVRRLS